MMSSGASRVRSVECLLTVLSPTAFDPLTRAYGALLNEPRTVGDVMDLCSRHQLRKIHGLGPRRIPEIETALVLAELDLTVHRQRCANEKGTVR